MDYSMFLTFFAYFLIYAFLGWCAEVAFAAVTLHALVNRGFLNGPICPIYGCGMVCMLVLLGDAAASLPAVFFGGMVITTLVELIGGWALYQLFHTRWWDYSNFKWNLGGYICPQFTLLWGIGSVALVMGVHPVVARLVATVPALPLLVAGGICFVLLAADVALSAAAAVGLNRRLAEIDEMRAAIRKTSDALTTVIGTNAMTMDELLDEQKLQLMLARMEGRDNAAELRAQLTELAARARVERARVEQLARQQFFGMGRLLRAFPHMKAPSHTEAMAILHEVSARMARTAGQLKERLTR